MFDDIQSKNQGNVPPNLPVGEPEDMFADADPADSVPDTAPSPSAPATTPAAPDAPPSALSAGILRPKQEITVPASVPRPIPSAPRISDMPVPPPAAGGAEDSYRITEPSIGRGILLTVIVVVVAIILGGGGWFLYQRYVAEPSTDTTTEATPANETIPEQLDTTSQQPQTDTGSDVETDIIDDQLLFGEPIDTDSDGLDDVKEQEIGTNPNNWDSDTDGLSDRDEVVIWKSDPNNPDSDGDTYFDGLEVKSGYNPVGTGKLFTPPTSTQQ